VIYLHKLLPLLLSPIVVVLALLLVGAWRRNRAVLLVAALLLWTLSTPLIANALFRMVEGERVRLTASAIPEAAAVVVLSGMLQHVPAPGGLVAEWGESADRFFAGLELMEAGKAPQLLLTRGLRPWEKNIRAEGEILREIAISSGVPAERITLTPISANTAEEAAGVRRLLARNAGPVILVTSAFHMTRARALFEEQGLQVIEYPVDFRVSESEGGPQRYAPDARALLRSDLAIREWLGQAYYALRR